MMGGARNSVGGWMPSRMVSISPPAQLDCCLERTWFKGRLGNAVPTFLIELRNKIYHVNILKWEFTRFWERIIEVLNYICSSSSHPKKEHAPYLTWQSDFWWKMYQTWCQSTKIWCKVVPYILAPEALNSVICIRPHGPKPPKFSDPSMRPSENQHEGNGGGWGTSRKIMKYIYFLSQRPWNWLGSLMLATQAVTFSIWICKIKFTKWKWCNVTWHIYRTSKFKIFIKFFLLFTCCDLPKSPVLCLFSESLVGPASFYLCPQGPHPRLPGPGCSCSVFLPVSFMCWIPILPSGSLCLLE